MRAYGIIEDVPDDDEEYSRVVPLRTGARGRSSTVGGRARPEPWTPRDTLLPVTPERQAPPPALPAGLTRTHRFMIAGFVIICVGMMLGMVMVRLWDEASRTVATLPGEGTAAGQSGPAAPPAPVQPTPVPTPSGTPVITTEIRVLQPNYTVAPGDTLGSIARRYGISVDALAAINNLENRNSLSIGQKLVIP